MDVQMVANLAPKDVSAKADQLTNFFNSPPPTGENGPDNLVLSIGSQLSLKWKTNMTTVDLELFQQLDRKPECGGCIAGPYVIASNLTVSNYTWTVTTGTLSSTPNVYFFIVHDNTTSADTDETRFGSSFMNFTTAAVSSSTTSVSSTATSSSTTSPVSISLGATPSTSSASTSSPSARPGPSASTLVPAILVPILVLIIAAAIGFYLFKRRRRSKPPVPPKSGRGMFADNRTIPELETRQEFPRELEGREQQRVSELGGNTKEKKQSGNEVIHELG